MCGDRRRRYDDGFRREALELIKAGASRDTLAGRLAMPKQTAEKWIILYRSGGEEAVMGGNGSRSYDWETKVAAARGHVENGMDWLQCIRQSDEGRMTWDWRPTMAGPKHPRHYDEAFKRQIAQSCESGKPSREIRAGHDIARSTPRRWVQGIRDSGSTRAADNRTPGRNEPVEPGRRNRQLEMEVDVSEQAAPVFARRQA
ncbi:transposase [uncultured Bifidobacterium sp.]|uniref:transposase n=1 Tax=uncultured Bifidobacterium sp. TaxID=165187 RepID=UPI0025835876|nr:transposase [uncultured Bifidobacterium sp.]